VPAEQAGADLEALSADVDADPAPAALARAGAGQQRVVAARTDDRLDAVDARARRRVDGAGGTRPAVTFPAAERRRARVDGIGGERAAVERQRRRQTADRLVVPATIASPFR